MDTPILDALRGALYRAEEAGREVDGIVLGHRAYSRLRAEVQQAAGLNVLPSVSGQHRAEIFGVPAHVMGDGDDIVAVQGSLVVARVTLK